MKIDPSRQKIDAIKALRAFTQETFGVTVGLLAAKTLIESLESPTETEIRRLTKDYGAVLTGSRFFGCAGPESDWDVFSAQVPPIFYERTSGIYEDSSIQVYKHPTLPIHYQYVLDGRVAERQRLQNALKGLWIPSEVSRYENLPKRLRTVYWHHYAPFFGI